MLTEDENGRPQVKLTNFGKAEYRKYENFEEGEEAEEDDEKKEERFKDMLGMKDKENKMEKFWPSAVKDQFIETFLCGNRLDNNGREQ